MNNIQWAMKHSCGGYSPYMEGITGDLGRFIYQDKICQKCGKDMPYESLTRVKGYFKSRAKWYNPLSWFTYEFIEIKGE